MGWLTEGLTWKLSDPGMGLPERTGLAALYMTLRAAEEQGQKEELRPLYWEDNDLKQDSVTIRSTEEDKPALEKLFRFAWQVRDEILYLPAVHRDRNVLDNPFKRAPMHNGITRTFLQHPRVQPKGDLVETVEKLDEGRQFRVAYQSLDGGHLKPINDLNRAKFFSRKGELSTKALKLSGWVFPGIAPRYGGESAWSGPPRHGLLLMLAPIVCNYQQLHSERGTWLFVVPDVHDLQEFHEIRSDPMFGPDPTFTDVASLGDAGLRFLALYTSHRACRDLRTGCRVVAMGKVGYYRSQSIRKGVVDVDLAASAQAVRRYRILHQAMQNRWMKRKAQKSGDQKDHRSRQKTETTREEPTHFVSVPTGRGRIADNLVHGQPWYADLLEPFPWDREALERQRKSHVGTSVERLWFNNLTYQKGRLMQLIQEQEMWDSEEERLFVEAFWEILGLLYLRERKAVARGGSRTYPERCEDLNEEIRRTLARSKTAPLLREAIADLITRPFEVYRAEPDEPITTRSKTVRTNPAVIWRMIDRDWKRGRDLALLALASYQGKEKREASK